MVTSGNCSKVFENDCLLRYLFSYLFSGESSLCTWSRTAEPDALLQVGTLKLVEKKWLLFFTREVVYVEISIRALLSITWPTYTRSQYLYAGCFVRLRSIIVRVNRDSKTSSVMIWWGTPSSIASLFGLEEAVSSAALSSHVNLHLKINLKIDSDIEQLIDDTMSICSHLPSTSIEAIDVLDFSNSSKSRLDYSVLISFLRKLTHIRINNLQLENCDGICTIDGMEEYFHSSCHEYKNDKPVSDDRMKVYMNGCWALTESSYAPNFWIDLESPMQVREIAQVVIISGVFMGQWVYCTVIRVYPLMRRGTSSAEEEEEWSISRRIHEHRYDIFVHPTKDFHSAVGFSGQIARNISRVHLRRVTPTEYDMKIVISDTDTT